jgi:hypothetical protein
MLRESNVFNFGISGRGKGKGKRQSCPCALNKHHAMKVYWGVEV